MKVNTSESSFSAIRIRILNLVWSSLQRRKGPDREFDTVVIREDVAALNALGARVPIASSAWCNGSTSVPLFEFFSKVCQSLQMFGKVWKARSRLYRSWFWKYILLFINFIENLTGPPTPNPGIAEVRGILQAAYQTRDSRKTRWSSSGEKSCITQLARKKVTRDLPCRTRFDRILKLEQARTTGASEPAGCDKARSLRMGSISLNSVLLVRVWRTLNF